MLHETLRFFPGGDRAVEVELGDGMDFTLNFTVHRLVAAIREAAIPAIEDIIPELASLQINYDPDRMSYEDLVREIAAIYARQGIRCNALCPGPVLTPLLAKFLSDDAKRQRRLVHIPMGRFGEAAEMVNGALFLASDESSYMTGQSLLIDGGITSTYTTPE